MSQSPRRSLIFILTMNTLHRLRCLAVVLALSAPSADAAELPVLPVPDWQPFAAQVRRVSEALTLAGSPLNAKERADLLAGNAETPDTAPAGEQDHSPADARQP